MKRCTICTKIKNLGLKIKLTNYAKIKKKFPGFHTTIAEKTAHAKPFSLAFCIGRILACNTIKSRVFPAIF
jgi:hypothetical protein